MAITGLDDMNITNFQRAEILTQALPYNVRLLLPYSIAIEDMTYEQLRHVLITERDALQNLKSEYGLSQGIKRGLELAAKWNAEDKNM